MTPPQRKKDVAWASLGIRDEGAWFLFGRAASVTPLLEDGVSDDVMAANPLIFRSEGNGVITKDVKRLATGGAECPIRGRVNRETKAILQGDAKGLGKVA